MRIAIVVGLVLLAGPGFIVGAWWARLLQNRADWIGNRAKMRASRSAFWHRLFSPIGYVLAGLLILATLIVIAGGQR